MSAPAFARDAELVEAVAKAILAAHDWTQNDKEPGEPTGWDTLSGEWQECFRFMAVAALRTIRESGQ
jgi:hypothetical protein